MKKEVHLTEQEQKILTDKEFLLTKAVVDEKITAMLLQYQVEMADYFKSEQVTLPQEVSLLPNKVNKGQNYQLLPYWVVDFPSHFKQENIFTYRTIVWWGNYITISLLVKGEYFNQCIFKPEHLVGTPIHYCVNPSPWRVEFEPNNLINVTLSTLDAIKKNHSKSAFLKLSCRFELENIDNLSEIGIENFKNLSPALNWRNI